VKMDPLRIMFIGRLSSGKTSMIRNFFSGDPMIFPVAPRGEGSVEPERVLMHTTELHRWHARVQIPDRGLVHLELLDTVGGVWSDPFTSADHLKKLFAEFKAELTSVHALVIAVEPQAVFGEDPARTEGLLGVLGDACVDFKESHENQELHVALAYTLADEYGIPYCHLGRLFQTVEDAEAMNRFFRSSHVSDSRIFLETLDPILRARFGEGFYAQKAQEIVKRSKRLWDIVFQTAAFSLGREANVYFCSSHPAVEGSLQVKRAPSTYKGSAGAIDICDDILARLAHGKWKIG